MSGPAGFFRSASDLARIAIKKLSFVVRKDNRLVMSAKPWLWALLILACLVGPAWSQDQDAAKVEMAVNRLSFGPTPGELDRVRAMGVSAYVQEQLNPEALPEPPELLTHLSGLKSLEMDTVALFRAYGPKPSESGHATPSMEDIEAARKKAELVVKEAACAKLWRALLSPRQLQELMVDFWYGHFNVPAGTGLTHLWVGTYEREAIRPHALGKFADLLLAVNLHPAMLVYRENWQNTAPDSADAKGKSKTFSENQARDILAGQTMGPSGAFKPQDVTNLARVLAGWSLGAPRSAHDKNGVIFDDKRHDVKDKTLLGKTIKGAGMAEAEEALRLLAGQPATAKFVCHKLARFFLADEPPKELEERLAQTFMSTNGDIKVVLQTMFAEPAFWDKKYAWGKFKSPLRYVVSVLRASGRTVGDVRPLMDDLAGMGSSLYESQPPAGGKDGREAWLNADWMLKRTLFAFRAGQGLLACLTCPGKTDQWSYQPPAPLDAGQLTSAMGLDLSQASRDVLAACPPRLKASVLLAGPEAQNY